MATTPVKRACAECGTPLPEEAEFCPVCALRQAIETKSDSGTDTSCELRFEHYTVLQNAEGKPFELGRGAMGVTYKAFDVRLQRPAALKIINAKLLGNDSVRLRFIREARAAASVRHPNVASVFHIGESAGNHYYAMEFVEGESLQSLICRSGCLETDLALEIMEQAAAGLAAIEEQHLVHRDIKPSNIMVSLQDGKLRSAKIIDLGLAKGVAEENTLSAVGAFVGTPAYASPEQFAGVASDIRSDLYSLGATLWEMLSGKVPFSGSAAELMYQHQHAEPPAEKLKNVPDPVISLLHLLLAKDPNRRFQTPAQFQQALTRVREAIISGSGLTADELKSVGEPVAARSPKATPKKQAIRRVVGSGLCVAAVAISWFFFSGRAAFLFNQPANKSIPAEKSIAVLPFENISPNKDDAYFADGVQDEILNNLAKITQLRVISRTSVMQYRGDSKRDLRQIANVLGVANVLEGTVRRDGNHVRISTDLVDAGNDTTIWADSYDRDLADIFAIQSEIAQTIATKLGTRLSAEENQEVQRKPTENLEAYDLYLRAKASITNSVLAYHVGLSRQDFLDAITLLEKATRLDPNFPLAYCQIAFADSCLYGQRLDATPDRLQHYEAAVREALRLNPNLPETHLAAGYYFYDCCRDYQQARLHLAIAERFRPNSTEVLGLAGYIDRGQGHWTESTQAFERACNLDPESPMVLINLACNYEYARQYRNQERIYDRLIAQQPDNQILKLERAWISFNKKADLNQWRAALQELPPSFQNQPEILVARIEFLELSYDWAKARELVKSSSSEELPWVSSAMVPRLCMEIPIAKHQGERPDTNPEFIESRDKLQQKVREHPKDPLLLSFLGLTDSYLGRNQEAIDEAKSAANMLQNDPIYGGFMMFNLATVYALTHEVDLAFQLLGLSINTPGGITYGYLRLDPDLDSLRTDPRFDKLLAELAPRD